MKKTFNTYIGLLTLVLSLVIGHAVSAQEFSPLGELAQDYVERLNEDLRQTDGLVPAAKPVIVNPEAVQREAVVESIDTISKTIEEVQVEKVRTVSEIKETVKQDIDNSIIQIRKRTEKPAYELQRSIDNERTALFENISQTIETIRPSEPEKIIRLQSNVDESLNKIQVNLETEAGLPVNFEKSKRDIKESLLKFGEVLEQKREVIESRQGALVFEDADADGISDYDEIYVYKTDPENARTKGVDGLTDGEKIKAGINPLSDNLENISYQDPRQDKESFVSSSYRVDKVQLIQKDAVQNEKLVFEGTALPNTYITLYIYSTPIVVTVKTNDSGQWSYELEKELENGEHQMFVATVDTSGKIVARSNPVLFTKSAEAATIGIAGNLNNSISTQNFLKDNFILITLATLIAVVVLGMMFVGNHKNIRSAVSELKNEVNAKY